jgi:hypothetical protein
MNEQVKALKTELNQSSGTVCILQEEKERYQYAVIFEKMKSNNRRHGIASSLEKVRQSICYRRALERSESQTLLDINETDADWSDEDDRNLQRVKWLVRYTGTVHLACSMFSPWILVNECVSFKDRFGYFTGYLYLQRRCRSSTLKRCLKSVDGIIQCKMIDVASNGLQEMPEYWDIVVGLEQNKENVKFDTTLPNASEAYPEFVGFM